MAVMDYQNKSYRPLKELIYLELKQKILTGEIPSKTRLMEIDLAESMNVSRTPIREAFKLLEEEGLIEVEPRHGARVANISIKEMLDIFEIRKDLEGFVAYLAALRCTAEQKKELRQITYKYDEASRKADKESLIKLDEQFHNFIVACCDNRILKELVNYVQEMSLRFRYLYYEDATRYESTSVQHIHIMQAIESGDADKAREVSADHVEQIKEFVYEMNK